MIRTLNAPLYNRAALIYYERMWRVLNEPKMQDGASPGNAKKPITEQECKVIEILRKLEYGELRIVVQASEIVQVVEQKSIKV